MKDEVCERMKAIDMLALGDDAYYAMLQKLRILEKQYDSVLGSLPPAQQDILRDYLSLCEDMGCRKLHLACMHMRFAE